MKTTRLALTAWITFVGVRLLIRVDPAFAESQSPKPKSKQCTAAYCVESEQGIINAFGCPADYYQCSGVDWKSPQIKCCLRR